MKRAWAGFRSWPTWAQWVVGAFVAIVVIGAAAGGEDEAEQSVSSGQAPTEAAQVSTTMPAPTTSSTARATTTTLAPTTAPPTTAAGPKTEFGPGTYRVGVDIAPGTYVAPGGTLCYWERQSTFGGSGVDSIIANDLSSGGQAVVTISASDKGFKTSGCGTWRPG